LALRLINELKKLEELIGADLLAEGFEEAENINSDLRSHLKEFKRRYEER